MSIPVKVKSKDDVFTNINNNMYFQQDNVMFIKLVDYVFSHQTSFSRYMPRNEPELFDWVNESTPKLSNVEFKLNTKIHWILMGLDDFPKCANPNCNNKVQTNANVSWNRGYVQYCSLECGVRCSRDKATSALSLHAKEDPNFFNKIVEKRKHTCLTHHGNPNYVNYEKIRQTCLDHLGCEHPVGNKEVLAKSLKTREQKYGKGNLTNYTKTAETCLKLYGHRSVWGNPEIHKKCVDKTIELYGSPNPGNKYELDNFKFDSKAELAYYIWLRDNNKEFSCNLSISYEYEYDGKQYRYFPDFIVEGQIIEIKGDHFFKEDGTMQNPFDHSQDGLYEAKHQCMLKNNIKILKSNEYNAYIRYVESAYGKKFLNSCKKQNE